MFRQDFDLIDKFCSSLDTQYLGMMTQFTKKIMMREASKEEYLDIEISKVVRKHLSDIQVLVACHPRSYYDKKRPHWQTNTFNEILRRNNIKGSVYFETIDILDGADHKADVFSPDFQRLHKDAYDIVILPDCGGQWFIQNENSEELIRLISGVKNMVKEGGIIMAGKIINSNIAKEVLAKTKGEYQEYNYEGTALKYIIIRKPVKEIPSDVLSYLETFLTMKEGVKSRVVSKAWDKADKSLYDKDCTKCYAQKADTSGCLVDTYPTSCNGARCCTINMKTYISIMENEVDWANETIEGPNSEELKINTKDRNTFWKIIRTFEKQFASKRDRNTNFETIPIVNFVDHFIYDLAEGSEDRYYQMIGNDLDDINNLTKIFHNDKFTVEERAHLFPNAMMYWFADNAIRFQNEAEAARLIYESIPIDVLKMVSAKNIVELFLGGVKYWDYAGYTYNFPVRVGEILSKLPNYKSEMLKQEVENRRDSDLALERGDSEYIDFILDLLQL